VEESRKELPPITVTYGMGDLFAINFRAWRVYLRAFIIIEIFLVGVILIFPLLDGLSLSASLRIADWWLPPTIGVPLVGFWFGICPLIGYFRSKRRGVLGPIRFSFSARGIDFVTPKAESLVYWSAVRRILRTERRLYLFLTASSAFILPRRAFATDHEFKAWHERSRSRWSEARGQKE
jgi:hypothetical protein